MCKFEHTVHITQIDLFELSLTANVTLFFFKAAKGVLTAGPRKAVKYAGAKLKKEESAISRLVARNQRKSYSCDPCEIRLSQRMARGGNADNRGKPR